MVFFERDADVLSLRMLAWVFVVPYVSGFCCEDAVISSEFAVFAGEPVRATLAEDDVAWNDVLACVGIELAGCSSSWCRDRWVGMGQGKKY